MNRMNRSSAGFRLLTISLVAMICLGLTFGLTSCSSGDLDAKVLKIIQDNPQAVFKAAVEGNRLQREEEDKARQAAQQKVVQDLDPQSLIGDSPVTGSGDRKIVLIEFSDFQCPFCSRAHATLQEFMKLRGNEVTLVYKHFPLTNIHPNAQPAALAAWAASKQGKFWEYHDALFSNQDKLGDAFYTSTAKELKLNVAQFNKDRASDAAKAAIQRDVELATRLGVAGTPFFLMNKASFSGAVPLEELEKYLDGAKQALGK